jgi:hypothetical protein
MALPTVILLDEIIVIIDLDDASNPEEFCYEYCLYDADNNVSNIVEVCVNIADWSEIGQLVGKWKFYKLVERSNLGEIAIQDFWWGKVDSLDCDDTVVNIRFYGSMEFDANGEFFEILKTVHDNGFSTECATLYGFNNNGESVNKVIGKWAYNQLTNSITVIIYSQIENEGSVFETVTNENYVFLSDYKFNLVNNEFVIEGENSDGSGYSSTYYKR